MYSLLYEDMYTRETFEENQYVQYIVWPTSPSRYACRCIIRILYSTILISRLKIYTAGVCTITRCISVSTRVYPCVPGIIARHIMHAPRATAAAKPPAVVQFSRARRKSIMIYHRTKCSGHIFLRVCVRVCTRLEPCTDSADKYLIRVGPCVSTI